MDYELKKIKKLYGEDMAHYCRDNFSSILETEGLLLKILTSNFYPTKSLYKDLLIEDSMTDENVFQDILNEFKDYIYDLAFINKNQSAPKEIIVDTPENLLKSVGYTLYECKTESDIQKFRKYYTSLEELCTFKGNRLDTCYVWFAVKDYADTLNRNDFPNPMRQDKYGTSVLSIQFTKDETHTLSIKNRYNHTVRNPDATFSNNLDNIVAGLTQSFADYKGMHQTNYNQSEDISFAGYVRATDGKFYKYNYEMNNVYYCPNNIIIDNFKVHKYSDEQFIIFDYYILDLKNKTIRLYENSELIDSFPNTIKDIYRIRIFNNSNHTKLIKIYKDEYQEYINILLDENNCIIEYEDRLVSEIPDNYMPNEICIKKVILPNVKCIGNYFLYENSSLEEIICPVLEQIGNYFLPSSECLTNIDFPNLKSVGSNFLASCNWPLLEILDLPSLEYVGDFFMYENKSIKYLNLPNLITINNYFLSMNISLKELNLPKLQEAGTFFLSSMRYTPDAATHSLELICLPSLKKGAEDIYKNYSYLSNNVSFDECYSKDTGLLLGTVPEESSARKLVKRG